MFVIGTLAALVLFAAPAPADKPADKAAPAAAAPAMDWSKAGPASRKVKDEKAVKKEVDAFFKELDDLDKKHDMEGMLTRIDFPVFMVTDDSKSEATAKPYTKDEYVAEMKPFWDNLPKDMSTTHKRTVTFLSDALADVVDDWTMTMGKQKVSGRSTELLVKHEGKWMFKTMVEAGWGDMEKEKQKAAPAK